MLCCGRIVEGLERYIKVGVSAVLTCDCLFDALSTSLALP